MATVSALAYYPIKGCAGVAVDFATVTGTGLEHDRSFMVTDPNGTLISQREIARLAVVRAQVLHEGTKLALAAPGAEDVVLEVRAEGATRPVTVHRWAGTGIDQGDDAAEWFSAVLGAPARLVRVPPDHDRAGSGETPGRTGFADSNALLVLSPSSLDELNARILERGADPVPMNRFRPNVVVSGWPEPHTEDRVRRMSIGTVEIAYAKRNTRCVVTTVDQLAGERAGPEPLRTLAGYRREPDGGVSFGMKASVLRGGEIFVGDEVTVTAWAAA
ncbi:MAG TPA: MOSC N-terminal beta barrel domain-containing protein [Actinophytocola sp.]|uniref:MOSC domain-containing protein n=1 Tax=Actinophytocola sp. TaxID=1872138 RepID=UPI002DDD1DDF|nr:MOSC N-terminal beta barrel domain-containing protein [Actinophytocola sp.]HEV2783415.1 MOSC N-terminal beta barrel domain-containing protein [Actinophytocola sp.]